MNKKSYFRGIGAGMIVTAIIMGVASGGGRMTDEEILRRAKEIENSQSVVLTEMENQTESSTESTSAGSNVEDGSAVSSTEETVSTVPVSVDETETEAGEAKEDEQSEDENPTSVPEEDNNESQESENSEPDNEESNTSIEETEESEGETVKEPEKIDPMPDDEDGFTHNESSVEIKIIKGDSSVSVSRRMYEAGLVESAVDFDKYLCSHGYDKSISVGTYEIAYGLDYEAMAKIITRRK